MLRLLRAAGSTERPAVHDGELAGQAFAWFTTTPAFGSWAGNVTARFLATNYLKNYSSNGINPPTDTVGVNFGSSGPTAIQPPPLVS